MRIRWQRFNIYLALALGLACGCKAPVLHKPPMVVSTLRLHEEAHRGPMGGTEAVTVHRDPPLTLTISKAFFLSEANVKTAKVIDTIGGFALSIQFDRQGSWLLEQYSLDARGKHIAIFSQFVNHGEEKINQGRWLAAPKIAARITDGLLNFTPDVTREEADQIVLGLNNVAKKAQEGEIRE